ncbi:hypothetical protein F7725_022162 [Dissostichus mawsoni]|uniref:Uncharacterized protein n=1 Tax=Dissostichus mawsoni TaxID=36200 RepID=A0A7J5ZDU9_DISMA|nr:hypothetical protein F7725_022162 [Dissostichus mawsoni]
MTYLPPTLTYFPSYCLNTVFLTYLLFTYISPYLLPYCPLPDPLFYQPTYLPSLLSTYLITYLLFTCQPPAFLPTYFLPIASYLASYPPTNNLVFVSLLHRSLYFSVFVSLLHLSLYFSVFVSLLHRSLYFSVFVSLLHLSLYSSVSVPFLFLQILFLTSPRQPVHHSEELSEENMRTHDENSVKDKQRWRADSVHLSQETPPSSRLMDKRPRKNISVEFGSVGGNQTFPFIGLCEALLL